MKTQDRRAFLKSLGVGAAALSFLPSSVTRAADPTIPKRFIAFFTGNGTLPAFWAKPGATEKDFTLGPILAPLAAFKQKLVLLDGLDNAASYDGPGAAHQKGCGAFLTGRGLNAGDFTGGNGETSSGWASGISIDQELANHFAGETPLKSLELGVQVEGSNNRHRIAYAGSDKPLPPDDEPKSVFERLFAGFSQTAAETERLRRRRQKALDLVKGDLAKLRAELGAEDRERLDSHAAAVGEIEQKLEMMVGKTCVPPVIDPALDASKPQNYEKTGKLQMDLLVAALRCDLTRFASVLWGGATSGKSLPWLGFSDRHHELSHAGDSDSVAQGKLVKINTWYAQQFLYLLQGLEAAKEADGSSVLDNSIVLWGSELSIGNTHSRKAVHWVMAGNAGGAFASGRYLKLSAVPHNNLLVSIANALGHSITTFGTPSRCTGALAQLV